MIVGKYFDNVLGKLDCCHLTGSRPVVNNNKQKLSMFVTPSLRIILES